MKFKSFLIKYAEIGVKGKNRFLFEDALVRQINLSLKNIDGQFHPAAFVIRDPNYSIPSYIYTLPTIATNYSCKKEV